MFCVELPFIFSTLYFVVGVGLVDVLIVCLFCAWVCILLCNLFAT